MINRSPILNETFFEKLNLIRRLTLTFIGYRMLEIYNFQSEFENLIVFNLYEVCREKES